MALEAGPAMRLERPRRRHAVQKAREFAEVYSTPPIPVLEIAQSHGLNVVLSEFGRFAEGVSGALSFKDKRLYVNRFDSPQRKRFTIAHEFGHWILHKPVFDADPELYAVLPRYSQPDVSNPFEQEANAFAAELLVPQHLLKQGSGAGPATLAQLFRLTPAKMEVRLRRV